MLLRLIAVALIALCVFPSEADAQSCTFSVSDVVFSNVNTLSGRAVDATGEVRATCTTGLLSDVRVCLNINAGSGGATAGARQMRHLGNGAPLNFQLYRDPGRTIPWGSRARIDLGEPVTVEFRRLLPGSRTETVPIYARIFGAQQAVPSGFYRSTFSGGDIEFSFQRFQVVPLPCSAMSSNRQTAVLNVVADVPNNCLITAQDINFGTQGVLRSAVDGTGSVDITCTPGTAYSVGLGNGLRGEGPTQRRMALGQGTITYGLYRDPARAQPWGSTTGTNTQMGMGAGTSQQLPVYGRVPAQRTPSAGIYRDTVVVTVTY